MQKNKNKKIHQNGKKKNLRERNNLLCVENVKEKKRDITFCV